MRAGGQEAGLQGTDVVVNVGHRHPEAVEPALYGVEPVQAGRGEGGAEEPPAAGGGGHLPRRPAGQLGEAGEPTGVAGALGCAGGDREDRIRITRAWVLGAKAIASGSDRPRRPAMWPAASGRSEPKTSSHLSSMRRAASSQAACWASNVTSGQGWWLWAATCSRPGTAPRNRLKWADQPRRAARSSRGMTGRTGNPSAPPPRTAAAATPSRG